MSATSQKANSQPIQILAGNHPRHFKNESSTPVHIDLNQLIFLILRGYKTAVDDAEAASLDIGKSL